LLFTLVATRLRLRLRTRLLRLRLVRTRLLPARTLFARIATFGYILTYTLPVVTFARTFAHVCCSPHVLRYTLLRYLLLVCCYVALPLLTRWVGCSGCPLRDVAIYTRLRYYVTRLRVYRLVVTPLRSFYVAVLVWTHGLVWFTLRLLVGLRLLFTVVPTRCVNVRLPLPVVPDLRRLYRAPARYVSRSWFGYPHVTVYVRLLVWFVRCIYVVLRCTLLRFCTPLLFIAPYRCDLDYFTLLLDLRSV